MEKTGIQLITEERKRQIDKEHYSIEHDDSHRWYELGKAAECYFDYADADYYNDLSTPRNWPWDKEFWKPKNQLSDFVRAGALWKAELERMNRNGITGKPLTDAKIGLAECKIRIDDLLQQALSSAK